MPVLSKGMLNPDHHEHPLMLKESESYICDGCLEPGNHSGYCCDCCNFVLHEQCFKRFEDHSRFNRFPQCDFVFAKLFQFVVTGGTRGAEVIQSAKARCDVCAKPINGYTYTSYRDGSIVNIHPPCATLPHSINNGMLNLVREINDNCIWCGYVSLPGLQKTWGYVSTTMQIHVGCLKDLYMEYTSGGGIFGGCDSKQDNSYLALPSTSSSSGNSYLALPSTSSSSGIPLRKRDRIKQNMKAIGRVLTAVLGSAAAIVTIFNSHGS